MRRLLLLLPLVCLVGCVATGQLLFGWTHDPYSGESLPEGGEVAQGLFALLSAFVLGHPLTSATTLVGTAVAGHQTTKHVKKRRAKKKAATQDEAT